jgi:tRNA-Thr(GGU) m(6)t(6)A37 methyltransferase TsaA
MENTIKTIAHIYNDYTEKFGVPKQSGLAKSVVSKIVFEPEYRNKDALRGLEDFSHIWLLWLFSQAQHSNWSPTVRPPILGGNKRMGVFATRSPFRPNSIGMSSVKIKSIDLNTAQGAVIYVEGADLMNGTPIIDIKPYLPLYDSHPDATEGFTDHRNKPPLDVVFAKNPAEALPQDKITALTELLSLDPRPAYQSDPQRIYKMTFAQHEVHFTVENTTLTVIDII